MAIYTYILTKKTKCEHPDWQTLLKDGWKFEHMTQENHAVMSKKGYINEFWNED